MIFEQYNLTLPQLVLLFLFCLIVVVRVLPEIILGVLCSVVFWVENVFVGSISVFWVLASVLMISTVFYIIKNRSTDRVISEGHGFLLWSFTWFAWMIVLWLCFPSNRWLFARNWLAYTILPSASLLFIAYDARRLGRLVYSFVITTVFSGLLSLSLVFASLPSMLQNYAFVFRLFAVTNQNGTYFAIPFALSCLLLIFFANRSRELILTVLCLLGLVFCAMVVILANARQVVVALGISMVIYVLLAIISKNLRFTTLLVVMMVIFLGYQVGQGTSLQLRWLDLISGTDVSAGRFDVWQSSWEVFLQSPIWGSGMDYFGGYFAHNLFLDCMAGQGIVGLVFFLGYLVFIIRSSFNLLYSHNKSPGHEWSIVIVCLFIFSFLQLQVTAGFLYGWHFFWTSVLIWRLGTQAPKQSERIMTETNKSLTTFLSN